MKVNLIFAAVMTVLSFSSQLVTAQTVTVENHEPAAAKTDGATSIDRSAKRLIAVSSATPDQKGPLTSDQQTARQAGSESPPQGEPSGQELAKKLANPVASLISVPFQSNFDFQMGTGSGWRYTLNFQPVIPFALNKNWNLISRTIVPIIHQGNVTGPKTSQNGLGDVLQSLFISPNRTEPFIWGIGPAILVPTATNSALGNRQLGLGPTILAAKQKDGWISGALANHIWRVAGSTTRPKVNATFLQPFLSYSTRDAWTYTLTSESTYDWTRKGWSVPIVFQVLKLVRFGKQPVSLGGGIRCWVTTPSGGPEGCGLRIVITPLFPKR